MNNHILIIDDNVEFSRSLSANLGRFGYHCYRATDYASARTTLANKLIDAILLDVLLGQQNGIELLPEILEVAPNLPVIVITGYTSIEGAVQAIKRGAHDYVQKPIQFDRLMKLLENAISHSSAKAENQSLRDRLVDTTTRITTRNSTMLDLVQKARKFAGSSLPILLCGENGTGKEIFADFIQVHSLRSSKAFVKTNCAAFPESLLDNELFGHDKGAFTGADEVFRGVFERASGGTLFLDEIGDMSAHIQAKILRVLQNCEIRRLGGSDSISVDVRFIAATNKNLKAMLEANTFREDLFFRLSTATLQLLPLRERREDIPLLVDQFLREHSRQSGTPVCQITEEVLSLFVQYDWPGNIRELRNVLSYAATLSNKALLDLQVLPAQLLQGTTVPKSQSLLQETEKNVLIQVLKMTSNNKKRAAEQLKISRSTLYKKMTAYGIHA